MDWLSLDVASPFSIPAILLRLTLAMLLGGIVGWEREARHKAAGLRTHMLVAIGSAAFTVVGLELEYGSHPGGRAVATTRILQGIVQGVGFLGAGQIILSRGSVHGITTAVGIWVIGSIGVACGAGFYALAIIVTVFTLIVLRGATILERRLGRIEEPAAGLQQKQNRAPRREAR